MAGWIPTSGKPPVAAHVPGWYAMLGLARLGGIPSAEAFGSLVVGVGATTLRLVSIPSAETFGTTRVTTSQKVVSVGIPSAEAFGQSGQLLTDDFNRADSTTAVGSNWFNVVGTMGILDNAAYPLSANSTARHVTQMADNDVEITFALGTKGGDQTVSEQCMALFGCAANGEGAAVRYSYNGAGQTYVTLEIINILGWNTTTYTKASVQIPRLGVKGDKITARRVGNLYTILFNGVSKLEWPDTENVIIRDNAHRFTAIRGRNSAGNYRTIDDWKLTTPGLTIGQVFPVKNIVTAGIASSEAFGAATVVPPISPFIPFNEQNIPRSNQPVPVGCSGVWITLIGKSGAGGAGSARCGGGGGGGGSTIRRSFVPVAELGPTYWCNPSYFQTTPAGGSLINIYAQAGQTGQGAGSSTPGNGGTGGVPGSSNVPAGVVISTAPGGPGGNGGDNNGGSGAAGAQTSYGGGGGGGGGGRSILGSQGNGGAGGRSASALGGTPNGGAGASSATASGGGGAGGAVNAGGAGGSAGGAGGGGGAGSSGYPGGVAGAAYTFLEWV